MVDETILGCIVLCLKSPEQGLLCSENLHGTGGVLRQAQQASGVADKTGANELAHKSSKIRCDGIHAVS